MAHWYEITGSAPIPEELTVEEIRGIIASTGDAAKLAQMLSIKLADDGFYDCKDKDTYVNDSTKEGIFLAGSAIGMKPIPDCISDGNAVAARVAAFLRKDIIPQGFY